MTPRNCERCAADISGRHHRARICFDCLYGRKPATRPVKRVRLYLAGPMTGIPQLNFPLFHSEAARLRALGFDVVNPAEINVDPAAGWLQCMRADLKQLVDCDGIAMLPGWANSRGARLEHTVATALGLTVVDAPNLRQRPHSAEKPIVEHAASAAAAL